MATPQLIPRQAVDFRTPNPAATGNLSLPSYRGFGYSSQWNGWQLTSGGATANFSLSVPAPQTVQLSLVMLCMASGGQTNNPITVMVNNYQLFTQFDPHKTDYATYTFYIPSHWLVAGGNALKLSLDSNASTTVTFQSVGVAGISPQVGAAASIGFETASPAILSIAGTQNTAFDSRFDAWSMGGGGFVTYNLTLDQPRLVMLSMNFCSMTSGGNTNNPFDITVNGKVLVSNYDPHVTNFHDEQWLVPANWVVAGNNQITVKLSGSASTILDYKRFGAAVRVV